MKFYAAPLEGITGFSWRNLQAAHFGGAERYFTPFISPTQSTNLRTREMRDVLPENNRTDCVPQLLTHNAQDFLNCCDVLADMGYDEVNLNLGCPSGTVTAKRKGSGLLLYPEELDRLLDGIYSGAKLKVSVKTRIGFKSGDEFEKLLDIYNSYPLSELIVHPRVREQFYNGIPDYEIFAYALQNSRAPICYNGDIFTKADFVAFTEKFPTVNCIMLGRGLIANPALARILNGGATTSSAEIKAFHNELLAEYNSFGYGDKNVLFKMKELWAFLSHMFPDSKKQVKAILKAQSMSDYVSAANMLFANCPINPEAGFTPR
ncbi:MAG: tRNA-dihydrouridine synthase family protein [Oscillospiraceae bacterium]|nr:tRNA-dihydrouridine synthase family protein [Oscillospiraceae bacterium]